MSSSVTSGRWSVHAHAHHLPAACVFDAAPGDPCRDVASRAARCASARMAQRTPTARSRSRTAKEACAWSSPKSSPSGAACATSTTSSTCRDEDIRALLDGGGRRADRRQHPAVALHRRALARGARAARRGAAPAVGDRGSRRHRRLASTRGRAPRATATAASGSTRSRTPRRRSRTSCWPPSTAGSRRAGSARSTTTRSREALGVAAAHHAGRDPAGRATRPSRPAARRAGRSPRSRPGCRRPPDVPGLGCATLEELRELIGDCHRCPLGDTRTTLVFGVGDPHARRDVHRRGAGQERGPARASRSSAPRASCSTSCSRSTGSTRERGLHRQRAEVPPAGQPRPASRSRSRRARRSCASRSGSSTRRCSSRSATSRRSSCSRPTAASRGCAGSCISVAGRSRCCRSSIRPRRSTTARSATTLFEDFRRLRALLDRTPTPREAGEPTPRRARRRRPTSAASCDGRADCRRRRPEHAIAMQRRCARRRARTTELGAALAPLLAPDDVVVLSGDLGAGKTQLTQGRRRGPRRRRAGHEPDLQHPARPRGRASRSTTSTSTGSSAPTQLEDLDYCGTLEADGVSVVEWGDRFAEAVPADRLAVAHAHHRRRARATLDARAAAARALARRWPSGVRRRARAVTGGAARERSLLALDTATEAVAPVGRRRGSARTRRRASLGEPTSTRRARRCRACCRR